jgi:DNA gyrase/topoisomerase IV subunit A
LISPDKIDEWIREVEERPASAELIIRYIANRLSELVSREEELAAQNIELLSGRKVEEYESRIASLEYQLALLKRQLGGEIILPTEAPVSPPTQAKLSIVLYNPLGYILRLEIEPEGLGSSAIIARLSGEICPDGALPIVLAINSHEELLFIFDSGRTVSHPALQLPISSAEKFGWEDAFLEEPRIKEELAAVQPITKMPLYEMAIQASRKGYVKKIKMSAFTSHLGEDYIGTGVKLPADKTCGLTFANKNNLFVMVSQEGYIFSMQAERLPTAIEEVIRLGVTDHIVSTFMVQREPSLMFITQNGKAVYREASWLEQANSFKSKGQSILTNERREAGTRIVGAAAVDTTDWGVFLSDDGLLSAYILQDLLATGRVAGNPSTSILSFSTFHRPDTKGQSAENAMEK